MEQCEAKQLVSATTSSRSSGVKSLRKLLAGSLCTVKVGPTTWEKGVTSTSWGTRTGPLPVILVGLEALLPPPR